MELIDIVPPPHSKDPQFRPLTPAQYSSCVPVVDYHYLGWGQHHSERFQSNTEFLGYTLREIGGFKYTPTD